MNCPAGSQMIKQKKSENTFVFSSSIALEQKYTGRCQEKAIPLRAPSR